MSRIKYCDEWMFSRHFSEICGRWVFSVAKRRFLKPIKVSREGRQIKYCWRLAKSHLYALLWFYKGDETKIIIELNMACNPPMMIQVEPILCLIARAVFPIDKLPNNAIINDFVKACPTGMEPEEPKINCEKEYTVEDVVKLLQLIVSHNDFSP